MKIICTDKDMINYNKRRAIANQGCEICPCCGNKEKYSIFKHNNGIEHDSDLICKGFFVKLYEIDTYHCHNCGARWESDPYPYLRR